MKAAPGATLPVNDIFGREHFIAELWHSLEAGSIRMEAERRIGKTCILRKMHAEPPDGWEAVLIDVEKIHSAAEFAEKICDEVHQRLEGWKKRGRRVLNALGMLGGAQIGPLKFPEKSARSEGYWKLLLTSAIEDLVEQQAAVGRRTVFLLDEMPWMLAAIADPRRDGPQTAMEVLDVLRGLRQAEKTGAGFRMVLCGSIGMHHLLAQFKRQGYRNQPVNDMKLEEVLPLDPPLAARLATLLLRGEGLEATTDAPALIAERTGGFPYYIHWVVSRLRNHGGPATPERIELVLRELLTAAHDPCDFRHFRERIAAYYPGEEDSVFAILDHAAASPGLLPQAELINVAKTAGATRDNRVRELLGLLSMDHYLRRDPASARYGFRHVLLRRWWCAERGLEESAE